MMKASYLTAALLLCLLAAHVPAQSKAEQAWALRSIALQQLVDSAVEKTVGGFSAAELSEDKLAVTAVDLRDPIRPVFGSFRGDDQIYPASVVKMFYMSALHRWEADGKVRIEGEVARGLADMITVSSNDATGYILDVLTGTSSGAEISSKEFAKWAFKRNAVNRYFASLGYRGINVNQKTFCEDAYGIEQQFRNYKGENRNMLTTDATARLLTEIATGRSVSAERSAEMMKLMVREWDKPGISPDAREFISPALEPGTKLWSKEGWTSQTRHDAAYIETPGGQRVVIVIFTENVAHEHGIIPSIAQMILKGLAGPKEA